MTCYRNSTTGLTKGLQGTLKLAKKQVHIMCRKDFEDKDKGRRFQINEFTGRPPMGTNGKTGIYNGTPFTNKGVGGHKPSQSSNIRMTIWRLL